MQGSPSKNEAIAFLEGMLPEEKRIIGILRDNPGLTFDEVTKRTSLTPDELAVFITEFSGFSLMIIGDGESKIGG